MKSFLFDKDLSTLCINVRKLGIFQGSNTSIVAPILKKIMEPENELHRDTSQTSFHRQKKRAFRQKLFSKVMPDFAKNTSLHGLRYVTEELSIAEKIFWIVTFLMSMVLCLFLIYNVWYKWNYSPVIITLNDRLVSVKEIPFPSMTICQVNFCDTNKFKSIQSNQDFDEFGSNNFTDKMELFNSCVWRGEEVNCSEIFKKVLTSEGDCYNFNGLAAYELLRFEKYVQFHNYFWQAVGKNKTIHLQLHYFYFESTRNSIGWSIDGYSSEGPYYPYKGEVSGPEPDLDVVYNQAKSANELCDEQIKIYMQHPMNYPQTSPKYSTAQPGQLTSLALTFSKLITSDNLNSYLPEARQCYYSIERSLRYFRIYTQDNCRLECISTFIFEKCGCVMSYMMSWIYHNESICSPDHSSCFSEAQRAYADLTSVYDICKCLPNCFTIEYEAEVTKTKYISGNSTENISQTLHADNDKTVQTLGKIQVYFKDSQVMAMRRWDLGLREYGFVDFLANCGGLLGLFLGFSSLSLVEIIYFFTLRLWCAFRREDAALK